MAYQKGFEAGLDRVNKHFRADRPKLKAFEEKLARVLNENQLNEEASDRFVSLIVELCVLAESSRMEYRQPTLTESQLHWFINNAWGFFNSFKHK